MSDPTTTTRLESPIQAEVLAWLGSRRWCRAWRNNTGYARTFDLQRVIGFGLKGSPDIIGFLRGGRFIGVETKSARGTLRKRQRVFRRVSTEFGCVYIVARDLPTVQRELAALGYTDDS